MKQEREGKGSARKDDSRAHLYASASSICNKIMMYKLIEKKAAGTYRGNGDEGDEESEEEEDAHFFWSVGGFSSEWALRPQRAFLNFCHSNFSPRKIHSLHPFHAISVK